MGPASGPGWSAVLGRIGGGRGDGLGSCGLCGLGLERGGGLGGEFGLRSYDRTDGWTGWGRWEAGRREDGSWEAGEVITQRLRVNALY